MNLFIVSVQAFGPELPARVQRTLPHHTACAQRSCWQVLLLSAHNRKCIFPKSIYGRERRVLAVRSQRYQGRTTFRVFVDSTSIDEIHIYLCVWSSLFGLGFMGSCVIGRAFSLKVLGQWIFPRLFFLRFFVGVCSVTLSRPFPARLRSSSQGRHAGGYQHRVRAWTTACTA